MKNIFYVLALLVIAAAAFFSNKFKGQFQEQQDVRQQTIEKNDRVSANRSATEKELKAEVEKRDEASKEKALVQETLESLQAKERQLARAVGELDAKLEEQNETLAELEQAIDAAKKALEALGIPADDVTAETIASTMKSLDDDRKELIAAIEELDSNIEAANGKLDKNRQEIGRLADRKATRDARIRRNAMESVITAVDQDWGFVVIGAGSSTGFTPQTKLIVKRDGRMIAEVKPSAIEATQTIAEIDPKTLAPGVRLQPGDRVILGKLATN